MAKLSDGPEQYLKESVPFFFDKIKDTSALLDHGCLTIAQCALWMPGRLLRGNDSEEATMLFEHYFQLLMLDVSIGKINPKHPITLIPYAEYVRMLTEGLFGKGGEDMPLPAADWLISLDDASRWFKSKGFIVDFDAIKTELAKDRGIKKKEQGVAEIADAVQIMEAPQPSDNWKMRIQAQAAILWRATIATGATPTKNNIKTDLAKWCRENNVTTDSSIFPSEDYIYRHVLRHWKPSTS